MRYTDDQKLAIGHRDGNLQILACAGSGKTEVISRRIAELISEGLPKESIVAFTFTDRAAEELKLRVRKHLEALCPSDPSIGDTFVGTIHAYCLRLLKELDPAYRRYEVIDESRQIALVMTNFWLSHDQKRGMGISRLRNRPGSRRYWETIRTFLTTLSVIHQERIPLHEIQDAVLIDCLNRYQQIVHEYPNFFFDYDQIVGALLARFQSRPQELDSIRHRLKYLVVDEYQDVDDAQEELIRLLTDGGKKVNVTVVGDDDQAIYGWRGTKLANIKQFSEKYPNVDQIWLGVNFRSTRAIVELAGSAVRQLGDPDRIPKEMEARHWSEQERDFIETSADADDISVLEFRSDTDEPEWIANRIKDLRGVFFDAGDGIERPIDYADMAILLRSVRSSGSAFVDALRARNIPVVVKGTGGLFDWDESVLVYATFCLLGRTEMWINERGAVTRKDEIGIRQVVRERIGALNQLEGINPKINGASLFEWIARKREELDKRNLTPDRRGRLGRRIYPQEIFHELLSEFGLDKGDRPWPADVMYNLGRFSKLITDFESVHQWITPNDLKHLCLFLSGWAAAQADSGGLDDPGAPNAVRIMTVHAAKGLEWPVVFLPRITSRYFPSGLRFRGPTTFLGPELFEPANYAGKDDGERRLWYVALTRCMKWLHVTSVNARGKKPTTFMTEIGHDCVTREATPIRRPKGDPIPPKHASLLPTTFTELNYFNRCPFEYQLRTLMGFQPGVQESYGYGQQLHNILAEWHMLSQDESNVEATDLNAIVDKRFHLRYTRDGDVNTPFSDLKRAAKSTLARYSQLFPDSTKWVLDAEKPFEFVDEESGALISGTIDLIERIDPCDDCDDSKRVPVGVVDFKAYRWRDARDFRQKKQEVELQLRLYAIAADREWNVEPRQARAHFLSPKGPPDDLLEMGVTESLHVDLADAALADTRQLVRTTVRAIGDAVTGGRFDLRGAVNGSCRRCDFAKFCPGYQKWDANDRTTPRVPGDEDRRISERKFVIEDLDAG
ncbi:MAG: ATP-dependent helicase [Chloroflexi bacterium]|nr:ATP-dependent helicase [Chloroflexota bacterium]